MLAHLLLTFQHRAGVSSYTSSFDLAETCVFAKRSPGPIHCGHIAVASLYSEVTGPICRVPLTTLLPLALEFSSYLPVSVCGTGAEDIHRAFLALVHAHFPTIFRSLTPRATIAWVALFPSVPLLKSFGGYGISGSVHRLRLSASP